MKTIVMKFGGAAVADHEQFSRIADIILSRMEQYHKIAVVISAMGNTTDQLIDLAKKVNPDPPRREYDMLLTVGERISMSLLAMALAAKNRQAYSFTGSQTGIITCSRHSDARIIDVRPHRILPHLLDRQVVIVAGFQGVSRGGEITTLGRGGSDTSAVALGIAISADKVEFFKDVPGIFAEDPKNNPKAHLFQHLSYQSALEIALKGAKVLHPRCIQLAQRNGLPLLVRSFQEFALDKEDGTSIYDHDAIRSQKPLYEDEN